MCCCRWIAPNSPASRVATERCEPPLGSRRVIKTKPPLFRPSTNIAFVYGTATASESVANKTDVTNIAATDKPPLENDPVIFRAGSGVGISFFISRIFPLETVKPLAHNLLCLLGARLNLPPLYIRSFWSAVATDWRGCSVPFAVVIPPYVFM